MHCSMSNLGLQLFPLFSILYNESKKFSRKKNLQTKKVITKIFHDANSPISGYIKSKNVKVDKFYFFLIIIKIHHDFYICI